MKPTQPNLTNVKKGLVRMATKQRQHMDKYKFPFLLLLFAGITVTSCQKEKFDKTLSFDHNLVESKDSELVCRLLEDSILLGSVNDFKLLNDTSFVVVDGRGAYLFNTSGTFLKQLGKSGQARGEMISPKLVYATSDFVYILCSSSKKFLIFDHDGNFKDEVLDFKNSVEKFVVDSNDETIYINSGGIFDQSRNKTIDVISSYKITENIIKKYGERSNEDEVLSILSNSGGLYVDTERLFYLHPGNLIIHDLDLTSDKTIRYKIEDKSFRREKVATNPLSIINNRHKLIDYLVKNSVVKGLFKDSGQFIIVSEIGHFDFNIEKQVIESQNNRKIKRLYNVLYG